MLLLYSRLAAPAPEHSSPPREPNLFDSIDSIHSIFGEDSPPIAAKAAVVHAPSDASFADHKATLLTKRAALTRLSTPAVIYSLLVIVACLMVTASLGSPRGAAKQEEAVFQSTEWPSIDAEVQLYLWG